MPFLLTCNYLAHFFHLVWPNSERHLTARVILCSSENDRQLVSLNFYTPLYSNFVNCAVPFLWTCNYLAHFFRVFWPNSELLLRTRPIEKIEQYHLIFIPLSSVIVSTVPCPSFGHAITWPTFFAFSGQTQSAFWRQDKARHYHHYSTVTNFWWWFFCNVYLLYLCNLKMKYL